MTERVWVQITSGRGPGECQLAVAHLARVLLDEAQAERLDAELIDSAEGDVSGGLLSALLSIEGGGAGRGRGGRGWRGGRGLLRLLGAEGKGEGEEGADADGEEELPNAGRGRLHGGLLVDLAGSYLRRYPRSPVALSKGPAPAAFCFARIRSEAKRNAAVPSRDFRLGRKTAPARTVVTAPVTSGQGESV